MSEVRTGHFRHELPTIQLQLICISAADWPELQSRVELLKCSKCRVAGIEGVPFLKKSFPVQVWGKGGLETKSGCHLIGEAGKIGVLV